MEQNKKFTYTRGYTLVPNTITRHPELSLKAKGMYLILASLPPTWKFSIAGLITICAESDYCVRSTLAELEEAGVLVRVRDRAPKGQFATVNYHFKTPSLSSEGDFPHVDNQRQLNKDILSKDKINKPRPRKGRRA